MHECTPKVRSAAAAVLCAVAISAALATWSATAFGGACGLISTTAVAKAFQVAHAAYPSVLLSPPKFGGVESTCVINAWSGSEPANAKQVANKFAKGKLAHVTITTWTPGSGLLLGEHVSEATDHPFVETLAMFQHEAQAQLITALHGKTFAPPALGAETAGYKAVKGHTHLLAALWWNSTSSHEIVALSIREGKTKHLLAPLKKIAETAVPAFGL